MWDLKLGIYMWREEGYLFANHVLTTSNLLRPQSIEDSKFLVHTKNNQRYEAIPISIPAPLHILVQLLKINGDVDALNFAETTDEQLMEGFDVLFIGHSYGPAYSFTMGGVCFDQRSVKELNLKPNTLAINLDPIIDKDKKILQVSRLYGGNEGYASLAEGCPMFNSSGEVVAIYGFSGHKFDYGLPVNKELVDTMLSQVEM